MYKSIDNQIVELSATDAFARAAKYGDGFFETLSVDEQSIFAYDFHYERIQNAFRTLYFNLESLPDKTQLKSLLSNHFSKINSSKKRISLHFFRDASGFYTPSSNDACFNIECRELEVLHKDTYKIGIYTENRKFANPLSSIKSSNALISVLAASWKQLAGIDDAILLNHENNLCEATASNLFLIKDKKIFTPPLRDAPVDGVMRRYIIEKLASAGRMPIEKSLTDKDLFEADEVFLSNTIARIQSVSAFGDHIKYKQDETLLIKKLVEEVN